MRTRVESMLLVVCLIIVLTIWCGIDPGLAKEDAQAEPAPAPTLSNSDCIKCHADAPKDIAENGASHKTSVTCMDCHQGHPPAVVDIIPQCSECHEGEAHFELEQCLKCHTNPHRPLEITLTRDITDACLTCHTEQIEQLRANKSMHTELACTACHNNHGEIPECLKCHEPHAEGMGQSDCLMCHEPHRPTALIYQAEIPSKSCAACHDEAYDLLTASNTRHSELECIKCHQERHGMVPQCQDCHGTPHPKGMLAKFPKCGICHDTAHNLSK